MNIPVHVAAAAVVCQVALHIDSTLQTRESSKERLIKVGIFCFVASILSHLGLDALPHYDFIYKVFPLPMLPKVWAWAWAIFKVGVCTMPVLAIFFYLTRDHLFIAAIALFGSVYPDIEKAIYLNLHIPQYLILFRQHSLAYSPDGWESDYKWLLSLAELAIVGGLLGSMLWIELNKQTVTPTA